MGNQFFVEQTGIEKEILEATVITNQKEIEINIHCLSSGYKAALST